MPIAGGNSFYELYQEESPVQVPFEIRNRVAAIFSRAAAWEDEEVWPKTFDIRVGDGDPEFAPAVAWAFACYLGEPRECVACVSAQHARQEGVGTVSFDGNSAPIWFVNSVRGVEQFFRWLIVEETRNIDQMSEFATEAFKNVDFIDGAFDGIKKMSAPYSFLVSKLVHDLGVLSDEGKRIFSGSWQDAPAEFGSFGVQISDENGNTKSNAKAEKERTIEVDGENLKFWWHIKLEPDRNRIHIHPDRVQSGKKIIVGIFCRHLTV